MSLFLYRILLYLALPIFVCRFLWRSWQNPDYLRRFGERFGYISPVTVQPVIWIHAVSVGEVNAAIPLVNALQEQRSDSVVITTMTTTGADRVRQVFADRVDHYYLPYDFPQAVNRFLDRMHPAIGLIMETELWPNLIHACKQKAVPLVYTNVRLSERSFKGYLKVRKLFAPLLSGVERFAVQAEADASRLTQLGARTEAIEVTGSLKFDFNVPASVFEAGLSIRRKLGQDKHIIVCASTHDGEESLLLDMYDRLRQQVSGIVLVLVPRHPERFDSVFRLCEKRRLRVDRHSNTEKPVDDLEVLLVDQMGFLMPYIAAGDVTFMGGSLVATGGHNLLEPAALGKPVIFGPHMFNFTEISRLFVDLGAGIQIQQPQEIDAVMLELLNDPTLRDRCASAGEQLIADNRGALDKVLALIQQVYPE